MLREDFEPCSPSLPCVLLRALDIRGLGAPRNLRSAVVLSSPTIARGHGNLPIPVPLSRCRWPPIASHERLEPDVCNNNAHPCNACQVDGARDAAFEKPPRWHPQRHSMGGKSTTRLERETRSRTTKAQFSRAVHRRLESHVGGKGGVGENTAHAAHGDAGWASAAARSAIIGRRDWGHRDLSDRCMNSGAERAQNSQLHKNPQIGR